MYSKIEKRKNIAFYFPAGLTHSGGVERVLSIVSRFLVENHTVTIISKSGGKPAFPVDPRVNLVDLGLQNLTSKCARILHRLCVNLLLKKTIKKLNIDSLILVGEGGLLNGVFPTRVSNHINLVYWVHSSFEQPLALHHRIMREHFLNRLDHIITLNSNDHLKYQKFLSSNNKVTKIENPTHFQAIDKSSDDRNKTIIAVGRLSAIKGYDRLIKAFYLVSRQNPDWNLKIFGKDQGQRASLENLIISLGLQNQVHLMGEISNIAEEMAKASILACTSLYECFPMVLLEAKSCSLPIVAFDAPGGIGDIVVDSSDGFLVKPNYLVKFANKIELLMNNESVRLEMSKASLISVNNFSDVHVKEKWYDFIDNSL